MLKEHNYFFEELSYVKTKYSLIQKQLSAFLCLQKDQEGRGGSGWCYSSIQEREEHQVKDGTETGFPFPKWMQEDFNDKVGNQPFISLNIKHFAIQSL